MAKKVENNNKLPQGHDVPATPDVDKVDFDVWHAMRQRQIPQHHRKEIIAADFRGRKLSKKESIATFDAALAKYGIKLD